MVIKQTETSLHISEPVDDFLDLVTVFLGQMSCSMYSDPYSILNPRVAGLLFYVFTGEMPPKNSNPHANKISNWDMEKLMRVYTLCSPNVQSLMDPLLEHYKLELYGDPNDKD